MLAAWAGLPLSEQNSSEDATAEELLCLFTQISFVETGTWRRLWHETLDPGEVPLALHVAALRLSTEQGQQVPGGDAETLVAVGTAFAHGEDHPCTGRVLVFRVKPAAEGGPEGAMSHPTGELVYSRWACKKTQLTNEEARLA